MSVSHCATYTSAHHELNGDVGRMDVGSEWFHYIYVESGQVC